MLSSKFIDLSSILDETSSYQEIECKPTFVNSIDTDINIKLKTLDLDESFQPSAPTCYRKIPDSKVSMNKPENFQPNFFLKETFSSKDPVSIKSTTSLKYPDISKQELRPRKKDEVTEEILEIREEQKIQKQLDEAFPKIKIQEKEEEEILEEAEEILEIREEEEEIREEEEEIREEEEEIREEAEEILEIREEAEEILEEAEEILEIREEEEEIREEEEEILEEAEEILEIREEAEEILEIREEEEEIREEEEEIREEAEEILEEEEEILEEEEEILEEEGIKFKKLSPGNVKNFGSSSFNLAKYVLPPTSNSSTYATRARATQDLERKLAMMDGSCPTDIINNLRVRTFQIDPSLIHSYLNTQGKFDHKFQDGVSCLVDALLSEDSDKPDYNLRLWINNITSIGKKSAEGQVFLLYSQNLPLFVIKVPNNPEIDTLFHEVVVGMGALNHLRNLIPNFMHTYASFTCGAPILDSENKVVAWCPQNREKITHLVLENIPAPTLESVAETLTVSEFLEIYLQILNALQLAHQKYDFTHYDLHTGNVLIERLNYPISIPFYNSDGSIQYLKTKILARIIDYGYSHVQLEGYHFGVFDLEDYFIFPDRSFPLHDAYKLLLFTYSNSRGKISNIFQEVFQTIYNFFDSSLTIDQRVDLRQQNISLDFFQLSFYEFGSRPLSDLIDYILTRFELPFLTSQPSSHDVNSICQDQCVSWQSFNQSIFNQHRLPNTIYEYCYALNAIQNITDPEYREELIVWLSQFDVETTYRTERANFIDQLNHLIIKLNGLEFNFDNTYESNILKLVEIIEKLKEFYEWTLQIQCISDQVTIEVDSINLIFKLIENQLEFYRKLIRSYPIPPELELQIQFILND